MTRLEAIIVLTQIKNAHETMPKFIKRLNEDLAEKRIEALDLAIESLSAEEEEENGTFVNRDNWNFNCNDSNRALVDVPSGDLVSRQDAIEVGNKIVEELSLSSIDWDALKFWAKELFDALPSADRPTDESCQDCPLYDADNHNCPRFNKVIPQTRAEMTADRPQVKYNSAEEQTAEICDRPKGEWVTDTTPTEEGFYLVTIEGIYGNWVRIMYRRKEYWCEFDDERGDIAYGDDEIFAWRPLPKPYSADRPSADVVHKPDYSYEADMVKRLKEATSADRPNYNLETIANIVKQLGHLDGCIADMCDRPKGEWKWTHGGQCSECGFHNTNFDFNFCPHCGAEMKGGQDE